MAKGQVQFSVCQMTPNLPRPACTNQVGSTGSRRIGLEHCEFALFVIMEEVSLGSVWELISPLLAPDDVVMLLTAACCWNLGQIRTVW